FRFRGLWLRLFAALALGMCAWPLTSHADEQPQAAKAPAVGGQLIRIPLPITGSVDTRIKQMVSAVLKKVPHTAERPVLVFEFSPQRNEFGAGSDFSRALSLARFLSSRDVSVAKTVAFIPRSIKGHAVLVALA